MWGKCLLFCLLILSLCSCKNTRHDDASQPSPEDLRTSIDEEACRWADSVAATLSDREIAAQMVMPQIYSVADTANLSLALKYSRDCKAGGIVLLGGDVESARQIIDTVAKYSIIPPWIALDAEWGAAMRLEGTTAYPKNGELPPTITEEYLYAYGRAVADECLSLGINMLLGPVVDVVENPEENFIGPRSFGGDPHRVARLGVAYARGVEQTGAISVAKHFPGHGSPSGDTHQTIQRIDRSLAQLDSIDLLPFREYIAADLSAVMMGHLYVPAIDPINRPASVSPIVMKSLLRGDMGFDGLILTDALDMGGVSGYSGIDALIAGADVILFPDNPPATIAEIEESISSGRLPRQDALDKLKRILFYKRRSYLLESESALVSDSAATGDSGSSSGLAQ